MSVEGYIFQQYAARQKKALSAIVEEAFGMARQAGFHNIEINQAFFEASMRSRTLASLRANSLRMPSVYVGGAMHEERLAEQTIARALEISSETLYVRAGILEEREGADLVAEIRRDPELSEEQKKTLIRIYTSFRHENEGAKGPGEEDLVDAER
jgi:hypothetical protein